MASPAWFPWSLLTQPCSLTLEQGTGCFPPTSMAKLQLTELGNFLPPFTLFHLQNL